MSSIFYTGKGDDGASLIKGKKIAKSDSLFGLLGKIDELIVSLSFSMLLAKHESTKKNCGYSIKYLWNLSSFICGYGESPEDDISLLESEISSINKEIPKINNFIVPGTNDISCSLNNCRIICRAAERKMVKNNIIFKWINRLSSLLFVMSIYESKDSLIYIKNL